MQTEKVEFNYIIDELKNLEVTKKDARRAYNQKIIT